ncbi:hypothetical protein HYV31_04255 [candidate division WWE3 bacterium]|nr:hypothetical protein [candidate division WWE3 bacterium]
MIKFPSWLKYVATIIGVIMLGILMIQASEQDHRDRAVQTHYEVLIPPNCDTAYDGVYPVVNVLTAEKPIFEPESGTTTLQGPAMYDRSATYHWLSDWVFFDASNLEIPKGCKVRFSPRELTFLLISKEEKDRWNQMLSDK